MGVYIYSYPTNYCAFYPLILSLLGAANCKFIATVISLLSTELI